jgi:hypothetical protein
VHSVLAPVDVVMMQRRLSGPVNWLQVAWAKGESIRPFGSGAIFGSNSRRPV